MAFWDDVVATVEVIHHKRIMRVEINGDIEADFTLVAYLEKVTSQAGVEIGREPLPPVIDTHDVAFADVTLEPSITKIRNGIKALVRALRNA